MHGAHQRQAMAVDGVALVDVPEQLVRGAQVRIGFIHCRIAAGWSAFGARQRAGQGGGVVGVMHGPLRRAARRGVAGGGQRGAWRLFGHLAQTALLLVDDQRLDGRHADAGVSMLRQAVQHVGRDHAYQRG
ncbi:hypothetical protein G6F60_015018 [Rhizopus arrhizus]|nr:hypothetical protein G6F60_015018 [Rhizopus arrhizus]